MKCLLLVDLQNDFMPGGNLAVNEGDKTVPLANQLMEKFDLIFATLDSHPANHSSFASNNSGKKIGEVVSINGIEQVMWPDHCVLGTVGVELHKDLNKDKITAEIRKGTDPEIDSYSGFFENDKKKQTELDSVLKQNKVDEIYVMGLATDFCVKFTVQDALKLGYKVKLIEDACAAVNLQPGDEEKAVDEMKSAGAEIVDFNSVLSS